MPIEAEAQDAEQEEIETDAQATEDYDDGNLSDEEDGGEEVSPEIVAKAEAEGWVPKDRFRGPPEKWVDAAEFVRRGEEILPFVQKRNRDLEQKLADQEKAFTAKLAGLEAMSKRALANQRAQLVKDFEETEDKYAEQGDLKGLRETRKAREKALSDFDKEAEAKAEEAEKPNGKGGGEIQPDPVAVAWASENSWYNEDKILHSAADAIFDEVSREMPGASMQDRLNETTERVKELMPGKFGTKRRGQAVEGGGSRTPGGNGGASKWAKLPKEFKAQGDEFIRSDGLYLEKGEDPANPKDLAAARERYAAEAMEYVDQ